MLLTFLIATPLLAACFIALMRPKNSRLIEGATFAASLLTLVLALILLPEVLSAGFVRASALFSVDALGMFILFIIALSGFFASTYAIGYMRAEETKGIIGASRVRQFYLLFELFLFAMSLSVATINPVVMWIAIEATSLSTVFLISFYNKPKAIEAAWKYLILNSLGLLLGLLGTLIFLALPEAHTGLLDWDALKNAASDMHPLAVKIAFVFILVGYGTKIGFVPLHTWKPDTYAKAPTPIVALLSGVLINTAFFAVLRFKTVADMAVGPDFSGKLLIFFGILSVLLSALFMFIQKNYKRLLAYSGIEHAGLIALGFGFGGIGTFAALLHMLYHALVKMFLFFAAGNIFLRYSSTKIKNVSGVISTLPLTGPLFFGGFIAIAGLPPFGLFTTKLLMLSAGMESHPWVAGTALFALSIVFFGFFRHITAMLFGKRPEGIEPGESDILTQLPLLFLGALIIVLSWSFPELLTALIQSAAANLTINP